MTVSSVRYQGERWLQVPGFEGYYEVSDLGRIARKFNVTPRTVV